MANTITGRILQIGDIEEIECKNSNSVFQKRNIVLNCTRSNFGQVFENYPSFELFGKHLNDADDFNVNDIVTVSFSIKGTKIMNGDGKEKFFNTISCYKIEKYIKEQNKTNCNVEEDKTSQEERENSNIAQEVVDDLPF